MVKKQKKQEKFADYAGIYSEIMKRRDDNDDERVSAREKRDYGKGGGANRENWAAIAVGKRARNEKI